MAAKRVARTRAYDIQDARKVAKASKKHWGILTKKGATAANLKAFEATIAEAVSVEASEGAMGIDASRQALKDSVGEYRTAGDLVARGFDGVDEKAVKALKLDGAFPNTDKKLDAYVTGIADTMKPYAAELASHDFGKAKQDELVKNAAKFQADLLAKPVKSGERAASTVERDGIFERLRYQTSWLRRAGRAALRTNKGRADFDRVQPESTKTPKKKKAPPA